MKSIFKFLISLSLLFIIGFPIIFAYLPSDEEKMLWYCKTECLRGYESEEYCITIDCDKDGIIGDCIIANGNCILSPEKEKLLEQKINEENQKRSEQKFNDFLYSVLLFAVPFLSGIILLLLYTRTKDKKKIKANVYLISGILLLLLGILFLLNLLSEISKWNW